MLPAWEESHQKELHTPILQCLHQSVHLRWMRGEREWILPPLLERFMDSLFSFHVAKDSVSTSPLTSTRTSQTAFQLRFWITTHWVKSCLTFTLLYSHTFPFPNLISSYLCQFQFQFQCLKSESPKYCINKMFPYQRDIMGLISLLAGIYPIRGTFVHAHVHL